MKYRKLLFISSHSWIDWLITKFIILNVFYLCTLADSDSCVREFFVTWLSKRLDHQVIIKIHTAKETLLSWLRKNYLEKNSHTLYICSILNVKSKWASFVTSLYKTLWTPQLWKNLVFMLVWLIDTQLYRDKSKEKVK